MCLQDALGTGSAILKSHFGEAPPPDWKVSQPQGEDNRRGTDTSHTPDDPKGSADFLQHRLIGVRDSSEGYV